MTALRRFADRLSYANVMSTIAVFAVFAGGTAYAAATIGSNDIKQNAVLSRHINNGAVHTADVGTGAITRAKLARGVLGARAYVHVTRTVGGDFVVDTTRRKNVVTVELPTTLNNDRPCLVLPSWINAAKAVAIASVDAQNTPDANTASVDQRDGGEGSQGCVGNAIALFLERNGVGSTSTIAFNVMVP
jgi:hypothetical protein